MVDLSFLKDRKIQIVIAVVVILLLFILYRLFSKRKSTEKAAQPKKKKSKPKKKVKVVQRNRDADENEDDDDEDDEEGGDREVDSDTRNDAEELYNLAHEGLAKGMQKDTFQQLVGDLADDYTFIELKQLYKNREDRNMDPLKSIHVTDYIKILQNS